MISSQAARDFLTLRWTEGVIGSTIEYEPADFVAQLLVIKHKIPDFARKLCTLPFALQATRFFSPTRKCRRTRGFDRISRCTELVSCDMRHNCRLPGSKCRVPGSPAQYSRRSHSMATCRAGLRHRDLAARPCASRFDGLTRPIVIGLLCLE